MFYGSKYICIFYLCNLLNRILHTCSIPECPILKQSKTTKQINRNNLFHNKLKDIKKEKKITDVTFSPAIRMSFTCLST